MSTQYKTLENIEILKDYDFETEKTVLIQKLSARKDLTRANFQNARPPTAILSPNYNFYKPTIEPKVVRAVSRKPEVNPKTRPSNKTSNYSGHKTFSKNGKSISNTHNAKPSSDLVINSIKNKVLTETICNDITDFDISQLKSEQLLHCNKSDKGKSIKEARQKDISITSVKKSMQYDNPYRDEISSGTKNSRLTANSHNDNKSRFAHITPTKNNEYNNKKQLEVNIFINKCKRDL